MKAAWNKLKELLTAIDDEETQLKCMSSLSIDITDNWNY